MTSPIGQGNGNATQQVDDNNNNNNNNEEITKLTEKIRAKEKELTAEKTDEKLTRTNERKYSIRRDATFKLEKQLFYALEQQRTDELKDPLFKWTLCRESSTSTTYDSISYSRVNAGAAETKNRRSYMEDSHCAMELKFKIKKKEHKALFYGVFDGHGDEREISKFLAKNTGNTIKKKLEKKNEELSDEVVANILTETFVELQPKCLKLRSDTVTGGSTASCALIVDNKIYVPNVGDSRTILVKKNETVQLSEDAKPESDRFKRAVIKQGGTVNRIFKTYRVDFYLAIARSLGDTQRVGYRPKITCVPVEKGDYLVLATDGLWDVVSSSKVGDSVRELANEEKTLSEIAKILAISAVESPGNGADRTNHDNITTVVVQI